MHISAYSTVRCDSISLFSRRGQSLLAQIINRFLKVSASLGEGFFTIHHTCAGFIPELFD
jgi:hypothetical protein